MERTRWLVRKTRWDTTRSLGWWHYVLVENTLRFGGVLFLVDDFIGPVITRKPILTDYPQLLINAGIFLSAGFVYGAAAWWRNERTFSRHPIHSQEPLP